MYIKSRLSGLGRWLTSNHLKVLSMLLSNCDVPLFRERSWHCGVCPRSCPFSSLVWCPWWFPCAASLGPSLLSASSWVSSMDASFPLWPPLPLSWLVPRMSPKQLDFCSDSCLYPWLWAHPLQVNNIVLALSTVGPESHMINILWFIGFWCLAVVLSIMFLPGPADGMLEKFADESSYSHWYLKHPLNV